MSDQKETILDEINHKTGDNSFITLSYLEVEYGLSGSQLRPILEDLKEEGLVVEHKEGFQISQSGINHCYSKWL